MFCTKCGAQNADGAAFCSSCGANLSATPQTPSTGPTSWSQGTPQFSQSTRKNPWIAAFLNLIFGLGYVYLGTRKVLGMSTVLFVLLVLLLDVILGIFTAGLASFVVAVVLAVDGWQKASGGKGFINAEYAM